MVNTTFSYPEDENWELGPPIQTIIGGVTVQAWQPLGLALKYEHYIPLGLAQQGELETIRSILSENARALMQEMNWFGYANFVLPNAPAAYTEETLINVYSPPVHGALLGPVSLGSVSQYFRFVQDSVVDFICEINARLRRALTDVCTRLGRVDSALSVRWLVSSAIRLFCSVTWEHRRYFLIHGARPPKSVQAFLDSVGGVCSGFSLAS